jgi:uncharacterized protein (DUF302 family)
MSYYFSKILNTGFDETIDNVTEALQKEGFGILTEIDVQATLKKKLDVDFKPYRILGACNPPFAYEAVKNEDKVGVMLPCNVVVIQQEGGVEVNIVDPIASMQAINNENLRGIAEQIQQKLKKVLDSL